MAPGDRFAPIPGMLVPLIGMAHSLRRSARVPTWAWRVLGRPVDGTDGVERGAVCKGVSLQSDGRSGVATGIIKGSSEMANMVGASSIAWPKPFPPGDDGGDLGGAGVPSDAQGFFPAWGWASAPRCWSCAGVVSS